MDGQNFDPLFGREVPTSTVKLTRPEFNVNPQEFLDDEARRAQEEGSVQFASGVVRVSDAPEPELLPTTNQLNQNSLGLDRRGELKSSLGLGDSDKFTDYYNQNQQFVPKGFEVEAKLLLHEEKVKKLESQYKTGVIGYQSFLFKAYGYDLLKSAGHDIYSSLYWYNRRKNGLFDSPLDNIPQLKNLLAQADALYKAESFYGESNVTFNNLLGDMTTEGVLPATKVRDLFPEIFKSLDQYYESDEDIIRLYRAGMLKEGFNPIIDTNNDGQPDFYYHVDGKLYRVAAANEAKAGEAKAYYNSDGTLDRIVVNELMGEVPDQLIKGFAGGINSILEGVVGLAVGIGDLAQNIATSDWEWDLVGDYFAWAGEARNSSWLTENNVYSTSSGFTNADGTVDVDGIARGVANGVGQVASLLFLGWVGKGLSGVQLAATASKSGVISAGAKLSQFSLRTAGSLIASGTGLINGVPIIPALAKTSFGATVQGLTYLAARDFFSTAANLEVNKQYYDLTDADITEKASMVAGTNMLISYLLRSTLDTPALTRHATALADLSGATVRKTLTDKLDNKFVNLITQWVRKSPKSFALVNTAMDVAENVLTMWTSASMNNNKGLFDGETLKSLINPEMVAMQLSLARMSYSGNLIGSKNSINEGIKTGGILAALGNENGGLMSLQPQILKRFDTAIQNAKDNNTRQTLIALRQQFTSDLTPKDGELLSTSLSRAVANLDQKLSTPNSPNSFVKEILFDKFARADYRAKVRNYQVAIQYFDAVVEGRKKITLSALVKGGLIDDKGNANYFKKGDVTKVLQAVSKGVDRVLKVPLEQDARNFNNLLKGVNTKMIIDSKAGKELEKLVEDGVEVIDLIPKYTIDEFTVKLDDPTETLMVDQDGNPKFTPIPVKITEPLEKLKAENPQAYEELVKVAKNLGISITDLKQGTILKLKGETDSAVKDTAAYKNFKQLLDIAVELGVVGTKDNHEISLIHTLGSGYYFMPSLGTDYDNLKSAASVSMFLKSMYTLRSPDATPELKQMAIKALVETFAGDKIDRPTEIEQTQKLLSFLLKDALTDGVESYLTYPEAVALLKNTDLYEAISTGLTGGAATDPVLKQLVDFKKAFDSSERLRDFQEKGFNKTSAKEFQKEFTDFINLYNSLPDQLKKALLTKFNMNEAQMENLRQQYLQANPTKSREYFDKMFRSFLTSGTDVGTKEEKSFNNFVIDSLVKTLFPDYEKEYEQFELNVQEKIFSSLNSAKLYKAELDTLGLTRFADLTPEKIEELIKLKFGYKVTNKETGQKETRFPSPEVVAEKKKEIEAIVAKEKVKAIRGIFRLDVDYYRNESAELNPQVNKFVDFVFQQYANNKKLFKELNGVLTPAKIKQALIANEEVDLGEGIGKVNLRDYISEKIFDQDNVLESAYRMNLKDDMMYALRKHQAIYGENTVSVRGNKRLVIDLEKLRGKHMAALVEKINSNPQAVALANQEGGDNLIKILNKFNIQNPENFLGYLKGELRVLDMLLKQNPSGFIVFENVDLANLDPALRKILLSLNYGAYDLDDPLESVDGIYFVTNNVDSAIEINFTSQNLIDILTPAGSDAAVEKRRKALENKIQEASNQGKYNYQIALTEATGNFSYIDGNTTLFSFLPDSDGELANFQIKKTFINTKAKNIFVDDFVNFVIGKKIEIKQGRNAGNLIKTSATAFNGTGLTGNSDEVLRNNAFVLEAIQRVAEFQKSKPTNETLSVLSLAPEEVELLKKSKLWKVQEAPDQQEALDKTDPANNSKTYFIIPVEDFETKAYAYVSKNSSNLNPFAIFPIALSNSDVAQAQIKGYNPKLYSNGPLGVTAHAYVGNYFYSGLSAVEFNKFFSIGNKVDLKNKGVSIESKVELLKAIKGKTVDFILKDQAFNEKFKDNVYLKFIKATIESSLKVSESLVQKIAEAFPGDNSEKLVILLGDLDAKRIIGEGLNKNKTSEEIAKELNAFYKKKVTYNNYKDYKEDFYLPKNSYDGSKAFVSSNDIQSLMPANFKTNIVFTADDITDIRSALNDGSVLVKDAFLDYKMSKSKGLFTGEANNETMFDAILSQSAEVNPRGKYIFISAITSMNDGEFDELVTYLRKASATKESIDNLIAKRKEIKDFYFSTQVDDKTNSARLKLKDNLVPTFEYQTTFLSYKGKSNENVLSEAIKHSQNMALNKAGKKRLLKLSQVENDNGNYNAVLKNFEQLIRARNNANNEDSRLIPNLSLISELGAFTDSILEMAKVIKNGNLDNRVRFTDEEAFNLAMEIFLQSSGVDYSREWSKYLVYDTEQKKVVQFASELGGRNNSARINNVMKNIANYFGDTSGRYVLFSLEKNMLHNTNIGMNGNLKYIVLDASNVQQLKQIYKHNAWTQSDEFRNNQNMRPSKETLVKSMEEVYSRDVTLADIKSYALRRLEKFNLSPRAINKLFATISDFGRNYNLADQAYYNTVTLGRQYNEQDRTRLNNRENYLNDILRYAIHHSELPDSIRQEIDRASSAFLESQEVKGLYQVLGLPENSDIIVRLDRALQDNNIEEFKNILSTISEFKNKKINFETFSSQSSVARRLFEDLISYHILAHKDGKNLNFLLNGSDKTKIKQNKVSREAATFKLPNGQSISIQDIADSQIKNFIDIESLYTKDQSETLVYQVAFKSTDKLKKPSTSFVFFVPMFLKVDGEDQLVNSEFLNKYYPNAKNKVEAFLKDQFPDFYRDYYSTSKGAEESIKEYFRTSSSFQIKNKKELENYVENKLKSYENDGLNFTYNGKSYDLGEVLFDEAGNATIKSLGSALLKNNLISENFFMLKNHIDILKDLVQKNVGNIRDKTSQHEVAKNIGFNKGLIEDAHNASADVELTEGILEHYVKNFTSILNRQTDLEDTINRFGKAFFSAVADEESLKNLNRDYLNVIDITSKTKLAEDSLDQESLDYISEYKKLNDPELIGQFDTAVKETINDLNYYFLNIDRDVQRRVIANEYKTLYANDKAYIDKLQTGQYKVAASLFEYIYFKLNGTELRGDFTNQTVLTESFAREPKKGGFTDRLGKVFAFLEQNFGLELYETGKRSLNENRLKAVLLMGPEEFFSKITSRPDISFEDYESKKDIYNGSGVISFFGELSDSIEGTKLRKTRFDQKKIYGTVTSVAPIISKIHSYNFLDTAQQDYLLNKMFTFLNKDSSMTEEQLAAKYNSFSKKNLNSQLVQKALDVVKNRSSIDLHYDSIYSLVNPAVYGKAYQVVSYEKLSASLKPEDKIVDNIFKTEQYGPVVESRTLESNEFGIKLSSLLKLTGLKSLEEVINVYGKELYIPVIRHPGDHIGSVSFYKAVLIAESEKTNYLVNENVLKGIMFGDFDGDHITIIKPDKDTQVFSRTMSDVSKLPYLMVDSILKDVNNFKFSPDGLQKVSIAVERDLSDRIVNDYQRITSKTDPEEQLKEYNDIRKKVVDGIVSRFKISEADAEKIVDVSWINYNDVSDAIANEKYVFFSFNKSIETDKVVSRKNFEAFKKSSLAKTFFKDQQALNDTIFGALQKDYLNNREASNNSKASKVFVLPAVSLSNNSMERLAGNIPLAFEKAIDYVSKNLTFLSKSELNVLKKIGARLKEGNTIKDFVTFTNVVNDIVSKSKYFDSKAKEAVGSLGAYTNKTTGQSQREYYGALNVLSDNYLSQENKTNISFLDDVYVLERTFDALVSSMGENWIAMQGETDNAKNFIGSMIYSSDESRTKFYDSFDLTAEDGKVYDNYVMADVIVSFKGQADAAPEDTFYTLNNNLKVKKVISYELKENDVLYESFSNIKKGYVFKANTKITDSFEVAEGSVFLGATKTENESLVLHFAKTKNIDETSKLAFILSKEGKSISAGAPSQQTTDSLNKAKLTGDILFNSQNFDITKLDASTKKLLGEVKYYNAEGKEIQLKGKRRTEQVAYLKVKMPVAVVEDFGFGRKLNQDAKLDLTTIANNQRSLEGLVLLGNTFARIDENGNFDFDSARLAEERRFVQNIGKPTLQDHNAMRLHHLNMLAVILSKIPQEGNLSMSRQEKQDLFYTMMRSKSFVGAEGLAFLNNLYKTYINGNSLSLVDLKLNDMEKFILSQFVYDKFSSQTETQYYGKDVPDLKTKNNFKKQLRGDKESDFIFGQIDVVGKTSEIERFKTNKDGAFTYKKDISNGFYSTKNYLNLLIDYHNYRNPENKVSYINKDTIESGTVAGLFNTAPGIFKGLQSEGFKSSALEDSIILEESSGNLPNETNISNKTQNTTYPIVKKLSNNNVISRKVLDMADDSYDYLNPELGSSQGFAEKVSKYFAMQTEDDGTPVYKRRDPTLVDGSYPESTKRETFLSLMMNSLAPAKTTLGRAAMFGLTPQDYTISISPKGVVFGEDNRLHFEYMPASVTTRADNVKDELTKMYSTFQYFDLKTSNKDDVSKTILANFDSQELYIDPSMKSYEQAIESYLNQMLDPNSDKLFGKITQSPSISLFLKLNPEASTKVLEKVSTMAMMSERNPDQIEYVFKQDKLETFGVQLTTSNDMEVNNMFRDIKLNLNNFQAELGTDLFVLLDIVQRKGLMNEFTKYSRDLGIASYIKHLEGIKGKTEAENIKIKSEVDTLLQFTGDKDLESLVNRLNEFSMNNGDVVGLLQKAMVRIKEFGKTYARLNGEINDDVFWILTPNFSKEGKKQQLSFFRHALFSPNAPSSENLTNMYRSYNVFDSLSKNVATLARTAAYYEFGQMAIEKGFMENASVFNFIREEVEKTLVPFAEQLKGYRNDANDGKVLKSQIVDLLPEVSVEDIKFFDDGTSYGQSMLSMLDVLSKYIESNGMSLSQAETAYRLAEGDIETQRKYKSIMVAYSFHNDITANLLMKASSDKNGKGIISNLYSRLEVFAEQQNLRLVDNKGRLLRKDLNDFRTLGSYSTEWLNKVIAYSPLAGGFEANALISAMNGDIYFMNKTLADHADKYFFTQKVPSKIRQMMIKANGFATELLMASPIKLPDRYLLYTGTDLGFLSLANPFSFLKLGEATNHLSEYMQSKGASINPKLQEYLKARGIDLFKQDTRAIFNDTEEAVKKTTLLNRYSNLSNKTLSLQHEHSRYAAYLAIMEDLEKNTNAKWLGSAYHLKDTLDAFKDKFDKDGNLIASANAQKALFIIGRQIGSTGDFPILAKDLNGYLMFTTFPLAMARWARGEFKSFNTAVREIFFEPSKRTEALRFLSHQSLGIAGLYMLTNLLISVFANAAGVDEDTEEEWKNKQAAPEFVKSFLLGKPVMNMYNSFNPVQVFAEPTLQPFLPTPENPDKSFLEGLFEFATMNLASRGNPAIKLVAELAGGVDIIGGSIMDNSERWSGAENVVRKLGSYVIGASGANALTSYLFKDLPYEENRGFLNSFSEGMQRVVMAELGNNKAYKGEVRNYYKANNLIQSWRFAERGELDSDSNYNSTFNLEQYTDLKKEISRAMSRRSKFSSIYGLILESLNSGVGLREIRSAVNNNSLQYKLNTIKDIKGFVNSLSESELTTIKDALGYEKNLFPWLDGLRTDIQQAYQEEYRSNYTPRFYAPQYGGRFYRPNVTFNNRNNYFNNRSLLPNYYPNNPLSAYRSMWYTINQRDEEE